MRFEWISSQLTMIISPLPPIFYLRNHPPSWCVSLKKCVNTMTVIKFLTMFPYFVLHWHGASGVPSIFGQTLRSFPRESWNYQRWDCLICRKSIRQRRTGNILKQSQTNMTWRWCIFDGKSDWIWTTGRVSRSAVSVPRLCDPVWQQLRRLGFYSAYG